RLATPKVFGSPALGGPLCLSQGVGRGNRAILQRPDLVLLPVLAAEIHGRFQRPEPQAGRRSCFASPFGQPGCTCAPRRESVGLRGWSAKAAFRCKCLSPPGRPGG